MEQTEAQIKAELATLQTPIAKPEPNEELDPPVTATERADYQRHLRDHDAATIKMRRPMSLKNYVLYQRIFAAMMAETTAKPK